MKVRIPRSADMRAAGARVGEALKGGGEGPVVIALNGELGAGKTTFTAGLLGALGVEGPVRSPTYTLVEPYEIGTHTLYHLDLYRLAGSVDLEGLGFRDLHAPGSWLVIEWADRAAGVLPPADLTLTFAVAGQGESGDVDVPRELGVDAGTPVGERLANVL